MQRVLVAVLVALALLQPVRPQVGTQETEDNHVYSTNGGSYQPPVLNLDHYLLQLSNKLEALDSKMEEFHTILSQHKEQTDIELAQLKNSHTASQLTHTTHIQQVNTKLNMLTDNLYQHNQWIEAKLGQLQTSLTIMQSSLSAHTQEMNATVNTLTTDLSEHTTARAELGSFQTSLTTTISSLEAKLDALTDTTVQLSSDHQQIQTSISDVECVDREESSQLHQSLQSSLTYQLEAIRGKVNTLYNQRFTCGGTGGWRRVVYLDVTDPSTTCPSGWQLTGYSKRTCGRATDRIRTCDSAFFPVSGGEYSRVCGRIKAYQWGINHAFIRYHSHSNRVTTINGAYVDGVSLTHGNPQHHIWTFAVANNEDGGSKYNTRNYHCPCDTIYTVDTPPFVGEDYFCESGVNREFDYGSDITLHSNDPLWDGENCFSSNTCCSLHNPPYFVKQLSTPTTDNIEARICLGNGLRLTNIAVELIELYVQ